MTPRMPGVLAATVTAVAVVVAGGCGGGEKAPEVEGSVTINGTARTIERCAASEDGETTVIRLTLDGGGVLTARGTTLFYKTRGQGDGEKLGCTASTGISRFGGSVEVDLDFRCSGPDEVELDVKLDCDG